MEIAGIGVPDVGLVEVDPLRFKEEFGAFVAALTARQSDAGAGAGERVRRELHAALDETRGRAEEAEALASAHAEAADALREQHALAVASYRQARLDGDASLPPVLVEGETVQQVDDAIARARAVVDYVRSRVDQGARATPVVPAPPLAPRVPAGAPGRTPPDTAAMSPREKLVFGTTAAR